ncbi:LOW QUALITY PROTEIN: uncharacterized protein PV09_01449 [Verruconis gallopava]|uniref:Uncharacterized protein n=1 Tax=Verruconis gallopava TaxID=253628 RepID=A0A0D1Z3G7_9PEZI|nr:LOW QUALITY PROTEIN: uncharacterized protein PV09_01449 [Verruconis gallopava]KIW07482.1 LOW QUALITY PROTEIN: hypothetical protein PV09_01449 [Verruconis gallopava]
MAKKGKKAKAAAAAAAAATQQVAPITTTAADIDQQLRRNRELFDKTHPEAVHGLEKSGSSSFSLPSSPVIKASPSTQPSPALSASATQAADENFKPLSLPPLNISEVLVPGIVPDIDWSVFDAQPNRGKRRAKVKVVAPRLENSSLEPSSSVETAEPAQSQSEEKPQVFEENPEAPEEKLEVPEEKPQFFEENPDAREEKLEVPQENLEAPEEKSS